MNIEDRFSSVGPAAFRHLCRSVGSQVDASRVMGVSISTGARWGAEIPRTSFGRRSPKSWRPTWFGYPSPLPAYDRICEKALGTPYLEHLSRTEPLAGVLERLRGSGLSLLGIFDRSELVSICRGLQIPDSSRLRWVETEWPSQWMALDRLAQAVTNTGWPEFVLSFEPERQQVSLQIPGLRALLRPLLPRLHRKGKATQVLVGD